MPRSRHPKPDLPHAPDEKLASTERGHAHATALLIRLLPLAFVVLWFAVAASTGGFRLFGAILLAAIIGTYALRYHGPGRRRVLIVVLSLAPLTQAFFYVPALWDRSLDGTDSRVYWRAAQRVEQADSELYVQLPEGPHVYGSPDYYLYPPFLAAALSIPPRLSERTFDRVWIINMLALMWLFAALLARLAHGRTDPVEVLGWGMAVSLWPGALFVVLIGNAEPLLWVLAALALLHMRLRGGFLAAALIKPYAIWPTAIALVRERGPALRSVVVVLAVAVILALAVMTPARFATASLDWFRFVYPNLSQGQFVMPNPDLWLTSGNVSLSFFPLKVASVVFGWAPEGNLPVGVRVYLTVMSIAPVIAALWLTRRRSVALQCAIVLTVAVLFGPICRKSYTTIFVAAAAVWWRERYGPTTT